MAALAADADDVAVVVVVVGAVVDASFSVAATTPDVATLDVVALLLGLPHLLMLMLMLLFPLLLLRVFLLLLLNLMLPMIRV